MSGHNLLSNSRKMQVSFSFDEQKKGIDSSKFLLKREKEKVIVQMLTNSLLYLAVESLATT